LRTIVGIVLRPSGSWATLRTATPRWTRSLLAHALPLALLPAIAWPVGQSLVADSGISGWPGIAGGFVATLLLTLACLLLTAAAIHVLAPFFGVPRHWDRAVAVAVHASTPVLLCGALLFVPVLVVASVAALIHALVLCSLGLRIVMGCKEEDCPAFVACIAMLSGAAAMGLGALCSAIGWI